MAAVSVSLRSVFLAQLIVRNLNQKLVGRLKLSATGKARSMTSGRVQMPLRERRDDRRRCESQRLVIAHSQQGISKVYYLHRYSDEEREALCLWEAGLSQIVCT
jgi:hypothetical protein